MRRLLAILAFAVGLAGSSAVTAATAEIENTWVCDGSSHGARSHCRIEPAWKANPQDGMIWLDASVRVNATEDPLAVFIKAFAASSVYWDGRLIGWNGKPANNAGLEVPGLRDAVIPIPADLSRPGLHLLQLQMSTMHTPVRLASPVVSVRIAPFEEALQPALRNYLAALLTAGGMLLVIVCLFFLEWKKRAVFSLRYLIGAALFAMVQLAAESSRAFIALLYPAQILRLELVLVCACGFALLLPSYLSQRFEIGNRKLLLTAETVFCISAALLLPGFDEKIAWVIVSSAILCMALSGIAVREQKVGAFSVFVALGTCVLLGLGFPGTFLDRDFYIWSLVFFAMLLFQETQAAERPLVYVDSSQSEQRPLLIGSGATRHLVSASRIVRLAAADDYTEVFISGAPAVLHPEALHKLLERLPQSFLRIHRSHAVNLAHLQSFRRGRRSSVTLSDQSVAPVSRRCVTKVIAAISDY